MPQLRYRQLLLLCLGCVWSSCSGGSVSPGMDHSDAGLGPRPDATALPSTWELQEWEDCEGTGRNITADPATYRDALASLSPGDTLRLEPGTYEQGLPLSGSGTPGNCIVIEALKNTDRPRFTGSNAWNIVAVHGASWLKVRNLDIDAQNMAGFPVSSQGEPTHHVVVEGMSITGVSADQQLVGISTKSVASDWVIRGNTIVGAGTGIYLGNSDGSFPFVRGVVEFNTIIDTIGYCMQIKHQNERPELPGIPGEAQTVIRWNVFSKVEGSSTGGLARPNLLLGHWPDSGPGSSDKYLVYGNFFFDNATEMLMQAEGNVAIYNNVFVNPNGGGVAIVAHNGVPKSVDIALNTILVRDTGIRVSGGDTNYKQRVFYNAVFGATPISAADALGNITGSAEAAQGFLRNPGARPGEGLDLHPLDGALEQSIDSDVLVALPKIDVDFDGNPRAMTRVGAYATGGEDNGVALVRRARSYE